MSRVKNVHQLAASRLPRRRRPMSPAGKIALAVIAAAMIVGGVLLGIHLRKEQLGRSAVAKAEAVIDGLIGDLQPPAAPVSAPRPMPLAEAEYVPPSTQRQAKPAPSKFTMTQYHRLTDSISYRKACEVMGCQGQEMARSSVPTEVSQTDRRGITQMVRKDVVTATYSWKNADGSSILAIFQDGYLLQKSQVGLR